MTPASDAPLRPVALCGTAATVEHGEGGAFILRLVEPLGAYPVAYTDTLAHWAAERPDHVFLRIRPGVPGAVEIRYAAMMDRVVQLGAALLRRGLSSERPVVILSGNDTEHATLALACLHVGIPYAAISPAYSLVAKDYAKLRGTMDLLRPGLVFAAEGGSYATAIAAACPPTAELVCTVSPGPGRTWTIFADLLAEPADPASVSRAHAAITPDSIGKILFTSGTTGAPKGVVFSHRMLTSQRQQVAQAFPFLGDEPPSMVDWLPWHHTFGGTHNFGTALYGGGTFTIDRGRPTAEGIGETVANLRETAPTFYLNTPGGFAGLVPFLRADAALRRTFFSKLKLIYYGGSVFPTETWEAMDRLSVQETGTRVLITSGIGCTEFGPTPMTTSWDSGRQPLVGLPVPGVDVKIVPVRDIYELRLRGPCAMTGYWRLPEQTKAAFDEEGYYRTGDGVQLIDTADPRKGLRFAGRLGENFKLTTGSWVGSAALRIRLIEALAPLARDAVVAGHDRDYVTALVFPDLDACRALVRQPGPADDSAVLLEHAVGEAFRTRLVTFAATATGSANRIRRISLEASPLDADAGEVTDKGSVSAPIVLALRAATVRELYGAEATSSRIISIE